MVFSPPNTNDSKCNSGKITQGDSIHLTVVLSDVKSEEVCVVFHSEGVRRHMGWQWGA